MKLPANDAVFELAPEGNHLAICYRFVDLGTQECTYGKDVKHQRKVLVTWELPSAAMADGSPFSISQRYTWSTDERSNLRRDLESWRGKRFTDADFGPSGFDIRNILGKPCMIQVVHVDSGGKTYANIGAVASLPAGMQVPSLSNPQLYYGMDDPAGAVTFPELSDRIREEVSRSPEYAAIFAKSAAAELSGGEYVAVDDSGIPF